MGIPQVIFVILITIDITVDVCFHRQPKQGNHSAWCALIQDGLLAALLYWGGFFG